MLYAQTTMIDDARSRGVRVCLGSDWGPSGTKNLLGEMKVARIVGRPLGYTLTDREIVEMVTTNPGVLLERCWHRPVGRLVEGAFADITVLSGRGTGSRVEADRRRDRTRRRAGRDRRSGPLRLLHPDGDRPPAPPTFKMTIAGRVRAVALPDPADATSAWSWQAIDGHARGSPAGPADGDQRRAGPRRGRADGSPHDAPLELFLDMPDTRRGGRAGPPKNPATVTIPPVPTLVHDTAYFDRLDDCPIQGGVLAPLRDRF